MKCSNELKMLVVAFGESTWSKKNVYKRSKLFTKGWEDINDDDLPECRSTSTTDENVAGAEEIIRRVTIREFSEDVGICRLMLCKFFGCIEHETYGSELYSEIVICSPKVYVLSTIFPINLSIVIIAPMWLHIWYMHFSIEFFIYLPVKLIPLSYRS